MAVAKLSQIALANSAPALTDTVVGVSGTTDLRYTLAQIQSALGGGVLTVLPNFAALRLYVPPAANPLIYVEGYNLPGDGGQGFFVWNASSGTADDGGTVINPTWNTGGGGGPNLVTNGNFASGSAGWSVTAGSPVFTGNKVSDTGEFFQLSTAVSVTAGDSYVMTVLYTMGSGGFIGFDLAGSVVQDQTTPAATSTTWTATVTSPVTGSGSLQFGAGSAAISMTNITLALAPGGRFLRQIYEPGVCYPEWWGAYGDGTHNDYAAITSAITWAQNFWFNATIVVNAQTGLRGRVQFAPGHIYLCNTGIAYAPGACSLVGGYGAGLDFGALTGGAAVSIGSISTGGDFGEYSNYVGASLQGFDILGYGSTNTTGVTTLGNGGVAHMLIDHVQTHHFTVGFDMSAANTFTVTLRHSGAEACTTGYQQIGDPGNSGEMMVIDDCTFFNGGLGIDFQNSNGAIWMRNSSIDYNEAMARTTAGYIHFTACHFETSFFDDPGVGAVMQAPFESIGAGQFAAMRFDNCEFTYTAEPGIPFFRCTTPAPYGIKLIDPVFADGLGNWNIQNLTIVDTAADLDSLYTDLVHGALTNTNTTYTISTTAGGTHGSTTMSPSFANTVASAWPTSAGKFFWTVTLGQITASTGLYAIGIGVATNTAITLGYPHQCCLILDLQTPANDGVFGGTGSGTGPSPDSTFGTVYYVACDWTNSLIWFSNDSGVHWNGLLEASCSPDAGTNGYSWATVRAAAPSPGIFTPGVAVYDVGDSLTVNFNPSRPSSGMSTFGSPYANAFTLGVGGACTARGSTAYDVGYTAPALIDAGNTVDFDPTFELSSGTAFIDAWYLSTDTATITSRNSGTNISISISTTKPQSGVNSMAAVKAGAGAAGFSFMAPCVTCDVYSGGIEYASSVNSVNTFNWNIWFAQLLYYGSGGVPVFSSQRQYGGSATLAPTTTYQAFTLAAGGNCAPAWATHVLYEFDMGSLSACTLYIDNAQFYRF